MIKKLFISTFLCFLVFFSGQNLKVSEIKKIFSQPNLSEWSMPIPKENSILLRWYPRNSSLKKEGIQSFVGYYQNTLVASLSIGKTQFQEVTPTMVLPLVLILKGIISFSLKMKKTERAVRKTLFIHTQRILN